MATPAQISNVLIEFKKWLSINGITSGRSYQSMLSNFPNRLTNPTSPYSNYLDTITDCLLAGQPVYAIAVCDIMIDALQGNINTKPNSYLQNAKSSLYRFREFLHQRLLSLIPAAPYPVATVPMVQGGAKAKLGGVINGTNTLIGALGNGKINYFIKLAIESSLFFSVDIVSNRYDSLSQMLSKGVNVPARYTNDKTICSAPVKGQPAVYNINGIPYNVIVDKDGNDSVRKLINYYTGYTVATGQSSIITGYVISHVWGRAFDPRHFTNFWNIVLIPSWANPVMDTPNPPAGSYASRLQNTIVEICRQLYNGTSCQIPPVVNPKDIVHGIYTVPVINQKVNQPLGAILKTCVKV